MSPAAARGVFWAPGTTCEEQWLCVAIINMLPCWGVAEVPPAPNYVNPIICRGGFAETACSCNTFFLEMVKFSWKWLLSLKHYAPRAERGQLTRMWLGKVGFYSWPIMPLSLSLLTQTEAGGAVDSHLDRVACLSEHRWSNSLCWQQTPAGLWGGSLAQVTTLLLLQESCGWTEVWPRENFWGL